MVAPDPVRHPKNGSHRLPSALHSAKTRDSWRGLGEAWTAISYLICGIAVWGGVGYGLDRLLNTRPALFIVGVLIGNAGGVYLMYVRLMGETKREMSGSPHFESAGRRDHAP